MLYQVIETEIKRSLVWTFLLMWLRVGLWLMFVIALGVRGSNFLWHLWFSSFGFRLPNDSSSKRVYLAVQSPITSLLSWWGVRRQVFYNHSIKHKCFSLSLGLWLVRVFLPHCSSFSPSPSAFFPGCWFPIYFIEDLTLLDRNPNHRWDRSWRELEVKKLHSLW